MIKIFFSSLTSLIQSYILIEVHRSSLVKANQAAAKEMLEKLQGSVGSEKPGAREDFFFSNLPFVDAKINFIDINYKPLFKSKYFFGYLKDSVGLAKEIASKEKSSIAVRSTPVQSASANKRYFRPFPLLQR